LKTKIIVISGAESTGKSELSRQLADHFHAPFIPEYARHYIRSLDRDYTRKDVEIIARKQIQQLRELKQTNPPVIFSDTWLIITKVWFEEVFGSAPDWLEREILKTEIDFYLVCDTDLPWVPDPVRENGGKKRISLQKRYLELIRNYGFDYHVVSGKNEIRFQNALNYVLRVMECA
jgi:nicotinamide riboside kinase